MTRLELSDRRGRWRVESGPALLAGAADGPGLGQHAHRRGDLPRFSAAELVALTETVGLAGRGGAGFPFARKVRSAARQRRTPLVVVNLSEGEPESRKDQALARVAPHLVLDGAAVTAMALGTREVHLVVPEEVAEVAHSLRRALTERDHRGRDARTGGRIHWTLHHASPRFVAGQSSAVLELLAGRPNLPATSWVPSTESGHRRRPTLLSNAETFAQVGHLVLAGPEEYRRHGTADEPGTTLLTVADHRDPRVVEVGFGTPWTAVLPADRLGSPVLVGGYHGTWAAPGALGSLVVSPRMLDDAGLTLGAGVVRPVDGCPVEETMRLTRYLAAESAGRCGPCANGLPALARAVRAVDLGLGGADEEAARLAGLVDGRGACAHPDGTARLVRSMLAAYPAEVAVHAQGRCDLRGSQSRRTAVPA